LPKVVNIQPPKGLINIRELSFGKKSSKPAKKGEII
jgi:hypothetical protein